MNRQQMLLQLCEETKAYALKQESRKGIIPIEALDQFERILARKFGSSGLPGTRTAPGSIPPKPTPTKKPVDVQGDIADFLAKRNGTKFLVNGRPRTPVDERAPFQTDN